MKYYIITTGITFAVLVLAHVARGFLEGMHVLQQPVFVLTTVASIGLSIWAYVLLKRQNAKT